MKLYHIVKQYEDSWRAIVIVTEINSKLSCDICNQPIQIKDTVVVGEKYESFFSNHFSCYIQK